MGAYLVLSQLFNLGFIALQVVFFVYGILAFRKYLGYGTPQPEKQGEELHAEAQEVKPEEG